VGEWLDGFRSPYGDNSLALPGIEPQYSVVKWSMCVCVVCVVTIDGVWIAELDLLTACTHHSELQAITALSLISTLYKSLHVKSFLPLVSPTAVP
jgi:hypothetical protein